MVSMNSGILHPHDFQVSATMRTAIKGHKPALLWFTGLSGAGKSTLADCVEQDLFLRGVHTALLDGDSVRSGLNSDLGFNDAGRTENVRRVAELSLLMLDAGLLVLAALVSPYRRDREFVRSKIGKERFIEIYIDTPLSICEQRDPKGLYQRARRGEIGDFTGIHSYYEEPLNPDIRVSWQCGYPEAACFEIVELLKQRTIL